MFNNWWNAVDWKSFLMLLQFQQIFKKYFSSVKESLRNIYSIFFFNLCSWSSIKCILVWNSLKKNTFLFRIERSRTIVPALIEAVEKCPKSKEINVDYFYQLLFTRNNLKLVHIVCHDKQVHCNKKCDTHSIYRPKWNLRNWFRTLARVRCA